MPTCDACKFWNKRGEDHLGYCGRWKEGYSIKLESIADNEVLVENDEGWGAMMGPKFGCVLHEVRS